MVAGRRFTPVRRFKLVKVGVRYCLNHHGIANEDDRICDFARRDRHEPVEPSACKFRELYRKEKR